MTWQFKLVAGLLMALGMGLMVWKYNTAIEEAVLAEQKLATANESIKIMGERLAASQQRELMLDDLVKMKQERNDEVQRKLDRLDARLDDLVRTDPAVRAWADTPIPDSVRDVLREAERATRSPARAPAAGAGQPQRGDKGTKRKPVSAADEQESGEVRRRRCSSPFQLQCGQGSDRTVRRGRMASYA
jgi:hypothetical protein